MNEYEQNSITLFQRVFYIINDYWIYIMIFLPIFYLLWTKVIFPYIVYNRLYNKLIKSYKVYRFPFRPLGLAVIGDFRQQIKQHDDCIHRRKTQYSNYDVTLTILKEDPFISLICPDLIKEFIEKQKQGCYIKPNSTFRLLLGDGLLMTEGEQWKNKRKILSRIFNFEFANSKFKDIVQIISSSCQNIKKNSQQGKVEMEVDSFFQKIFGTVVIKSFFGQVQFGSINGKQPFTFLNGIFIKMQNVGQTWSTLFLSRGLRKMGIRKIDRQLNEQNRLFKQYTKNIINQIIQKIKENPKNQASDGLIGKLIRQGRLVQSCSDQEKYQKGLYNYEDLISQMCTFFFAGTDTTSTLISNLIGLLVDHPQVQKKLRKQISQVLEDNLDNLSLQNIKKMNYLNNVQNEILRLLTAVPFLITRQAVKDHMIGNIQVKKDYYVTVQITANHYRKNYYQNPLQFIPQRWQSISNKNANQYSFFPFSTGPRVCIGQQLSLLQGKIAIIYFLSNFKNGIRLYEKPVYVVKGTYGLQQTKMRFDVI